MKYFALFGLGFAMLAATVAVSGEANAVVYCAQGVYRAGCVARPAPRAVVVSPGPRAVVVRPAPRVHVVR
jgi:hypothetical protein